MRARFIDQTFKIYLFACVLGTVLITAITLGMLGKETLRFFARVSPFEFLFGREWQPMMDPQTYGVLPLVNGTLLVAFGSVALALPIGLLVAAYLSEFASKKFRVSLKPILELLAGIPTVVYGYFAISFVTPLLQQVLPQTQVFNCASAIIVVAIMILPMITSLSDDAFRAVPASLREGGFALGATPYEVATQIVLPAASFRVGGAVVLALSRAIGETMAVTLAAGADPKLSYNLLESMQTMTAYIVQVSMGDIPATGTPYLTCFAVGALLFAMTMGMNFLGNRILFKRQAVGL